METMTIHREALGTIINALTYSIDGLADDIREKIAENTQLRDELAEAKRQAERATLCDSLSEISEVLRSAGVSMGEGTLEAVKQLAKERDALQVAVQNLTDTNASIEAKLPDRMMMNDGGKLWEVFQNAELPIENGDQILSFVDDKLIRWALPGSHVMQKWNIYRRPITADQLRAWLPSDAKPVGYLPRPVVAIDSYCHINPYPAGKYIVPVYLAPPETTGEVLFEGNVTCGTIYEGIDYAKGVSFGFDIAQDVSLYLLKPDSKYHVTIRKAGA